LGALRNCDFSFHVAEKSVRKLNKVKIQGFFGEKFQFAKIQHGEEGKRMRAKRWNQRMMVVGV
jgi:hypothetical protein